MSLMPNLPTVITIIPGLERHLRHLITPVHNLATERYEFSSEKMALVIQIALKGQIE